MHINTNKYKELLNEKIDNFKNMKKIIRFDENDYDEFRRQYFITVQNIKDVFGKGEALRFLFATDPFKIIDIDKNYLNQILDLLYGYIESITIIFDENGKQNRNSEIMTLFLSHADFDNVIATNIKNVIKNYTKNKINIFQSSYPGDISTGSNWLDEIQNKLFLSDGAIFLITPNSIKRPWFWSEFGTINYRVQNEGIHIYPLCVKEVDQSSIPQPLNIYQACSLRNEKEVESF